MFRKTCMLLVASSMLIGLVGCGSSKSPTSPGIEPEIINGAESFEFQVTALVNYAGQLTYQWDNSGVSANVDESSSLTDGSVMLTIEDADGTVVHDGAVTDGSFPTSDGTAGMWTVRVRFTGTSGSLNFRLQPRTP